MIYNWEMDRARKESTATLRDWIWAAVSAGQPIPGCLSVDSCRAALIERGEDGSGFHNT